MKKTILTLIAFITLLTSVTLIPANAAIADPGETVMPLWDNTKVITTNMIFSEGNVGTADISVTGRPGVSQIEITIKVYKQVGSTWELLAEGNYVTYSLQAAYDKHFPAELGGNYWAEYTIAVTGNGSTETIVRNKYGTYQ